MNSGKFYKESLQLKKSTYKREDCKQTQPCLFLIFLHFQNIHHYSNQSIQLLLLIFVQPFPPREQRKTMVQQQEGAFGSMIDRALNFGPVQQQSYYFQLIPVSLSIINPESEVPAAGTTYRFSILKGQQKFDENKVLIEAKFDQSSRPPIMDISSCRLNFYLPTFNKVRRQEFQLRLTQNQHNQDYEIGDYTIDANALIAAYKQNHITRHELKSTFSEDYELAFEIYVERTRVAVEKVVKEFKQESIKSPAKASQQASPTPKKEAPAQTPQVQPVNDQQTPSRDTEEPRPEPTPTRNSRKQSPQREEPPSLPKVEKPVKEPSQKNEAASQRSASKLPVIQTRLKAVTKEDAPAEVRKTDSQRLTSSSTPESLAKPSGQPDLKQKVMLWAFLLFSGVVMYFAMQPNSRV